ncbi:MAG TPA: DUF4190 domain-containing protein [Jatrophihabitans sp.]|jgi:hypothetical protein|uniref:DUF4190 domain-containing protein n=1 Tax=Jatrophihabitans sp. TaxID=1932789 RepID=UPI002E0C51BA|nr:DUF4190 domain-containing protein [Jatrophihabitans sp.]
MTTPSDPGDPRAEPGVDLGKRAPASSDPTSEAPFDPYRFGKPEHPVPPEYAPPGYVPDPADYPASRPAGAYPATPYPAPPPQPYGYPGTPYPGPPQPGTHEPYRPYGAPTPPPYHGYVQPRRGNGKAITALVCGLASIPLCFLSVLDAILIVPAVIFGIITLSEVKAGGSGKGMAIAGLACAAVGAVLATIVTLWYVHAANQCGGLNQGNSTEFQQCLRDHL